MSKRKYPRLRVTALLGTPVLVYGAGEKMDITEDFHDALVTWLCNGTLPGKGKKSIKELRSPEGELHFGAYGDGTTKSLW